MKGRERYAFRVWVLGFIALAVIAFYETALKPAALWLWSLI